MSRPSSDADLAGERWCDSRTGMPSTTPGPVVWVLPPVVAVSPAVCANADGGGRLNSGTARTSWPICVGFASAATWTCQSTATARTARSVIVARECARNEPSEASNATAIAIPHAAADKTRRTSPERVRATRCRSCDAGFPCLGSGRRRAWPTASGSRCATRGSCVDTTSAAPSSSQTSEQNVQHHCACLMVELPGRFVGEDELRSSGEDAGNSDALRLPTGQLLGQLVGEIGDGELLECLPRPVIASSGSVSASNSGNATFSVTSRRGQQARALEHQTDSPGMGERMAVQRRPAHAARRSASRDRPSDAAAWTCRTRTGRSARFAFRRAPRS